MRRLRVSGSLLTLLCWGLLAWNARNAIVLHQAADRNFFAALPVLHHHQAVKVDLSSGGSKGWERDGLRHLVPTNTSCEGFKGIYHIHMADVEGGVGTALFQLVIGQILYAEENNLKAWIHFGDLSRVIYDPVVHGAGSGVSFKAMVGQNATIIQGIHRRDRTPGPPDENAPLVSRQLEFPGTGLWNHYFHPVSDFVPGDTSCETEPYVTMSLYLVTPGLHGFSKDKATRAWRYDYLPDYVAKPHLPITEWLEPQRQRAHNVITKHFRLRKHLKERVQIANPDCSLPHSCLGVHIRHSDKAAGRVQIPTKSFLPYVQAFVEAGGDHVYIATDSSLVIDEIRTTWPAAVVERIRTLSGAVRSTDEKAVFDLTGSHHRTNEEILVEIYALAKCQFLLHSLSAVSEAAIWINLSLHERSVNLEDPNCISSNSFHHMVHLVKDGKIDKLPGPRRTIEWWKRSGASADVTVSGLAGEPCEGASDILLIREAGNSESTGGAFFDVVLNQLNYAERLSLLPVIHLGPANSAAIYDSHEHSRPDKTHVPSVIDIGLRSATNMSDVELQLGSSSKAGELVGSGIWSSYLEPVGVWKPGASSCIGRRVYSLERNAISHLQSNDPNYIRPWRYNGVKDSIWVPPGVTRKKHRRKMVLRASYLVNKYFQFQPYLIERAEHVNPNSSVPCLAVHLRTGDKGGKYRRRVKANEFLEYIEAFLAAGGTTVYLATDSHKSFGYVLKNFPKKVVASIRTQGPDTVRTTKMMPLHFIEDHHRVNSEALVDALAMSKCGALLHGYSTLSEAAVYINPSLLETSVNMEESDRIAATGFSELLKNTILSTKLK